MLRTPLDLEREKVLREKGALKMRAAMSGVKAGGQEFEAGEKVVLQDPKTGKWTREATVKEPREGARSYVVTDDRGQMRLRSGRMMRSADTARYVQDKGATSVPGLMLQREARPRMPNHGVGAGVLG